MLSQTEVDEVTQRLVDIGRRIDAMTKDATSDDWKERFVEVLSLFSDFMELLRTHDLTA